MGMDPVSLGLMAVSIGAGVYSATNRPKPPKPMTPGAPPKAVEGALEDTSGKVRKYRPAAQLFKDDDLRLGGAGKLGL